MHQVLQVPQLAVPALLLQEIPLEPKYLFSSSTFLEDILTFTNQLFIFFVALKLVICRQFLYFRAVWQH